MAKYKLTKAFTPPMQRLGRVPGQVPSRQSMDVFKEAQRMSKLTTPFESEMKDGAYLSIQSVVDNMGFTQEQENEWSRFIKETVRGGNDISVRGTLLQKMMEDKMDPAQRRELFKRSMGYFREMKKSMPTFTIDLQKARGATPVNSKTKGGYTVKMVNGKKVYVKEDAKQMGLFGGSSEKKADPKVSVNVAGNDIYLTVGGKTLRLPKGDKENVQKIQKFVGDMGHSADQAQNIKKQVVVALDQKGITSKEVPKPKAEPKKVEEKKPEESPEEQERKAAIEAYKEKQEAKEERYTMRADKARKEAARLSASSHADIKHIPFGQPILVGHHSERRHRRDIERSNNKMRQSIEAQQKAAYYESKAEGVGKSGISSDDPEAVVKLKQKIDREEKNKELKKKANRLIRKKGMTSEKLAEEMGWKVSTAVEVMKPDFMGRVGFPNYELTNAGANIRRMKQRVDLLLQQAARPEAKPVEGKGYRIEENKADNRIRLFFDMKPSKEHRTKLKREGFRWSPSVGAWQRHLNNAGRYAVESIRKELFPDDLQKADPKGGSYYRRTKTKSGKYRYWYNKEDYDNSQDAHPSGEDAAKSYINKCVTSRIEKAGDKGCSIKEINDLVQKYGSKVVGSTLKESCGPKGSLSFKKGSLYRR